MKTKQFFFIIAFLFMIIGLCACKANEPQYEIYENHAVSACGVDDPLANIEWLKAQCDAIVLKQKDIRLGFKIDLYEEYETGNHVILIPYSPSQGVFDNKVYDCSGNITRYFAGTSGESGTVSPAFPLNVYCKHIATIWAITIE